MKRLVLAFLIMTSVAMGSVFAQDTENTTVTPDYFTFNIGSMCVYGVKTSDFTVMNDFGIQLKINDNFSTGFNIVNSNSFINITASPKANLSFSLYTGQISSSVAFGLGTGYDFFTSKENFFTGMGIYVNWYACSDSALDEALGNGGIIALGLKAKLGL